MKKILTLLIALMIALLGGCNAGSTEKPSDATSEPNYKFDYFLDKIESYDYYYYLENPYEWVDAESIEFFFTFDQPSGGIFQRTEMVLNRESGMSFLYSVLENTANYPILTGNDKNDFYSRSVNLVKNIYEKFENEIERELGVLPKNIHTTLGNRIGAKTLWEENDKTIRIGKDYFLIQVKVEKKELENNYFNILSKTDLHNIIEEEIYGYLEHGKEGKNIKNSIYLPYILSSQLTLKKIYSEE